MLSLYTGFDKQEKLLQGRNKYAIFYKQVFKYWRILECQENAKFVEKGQ